MKQKQYMLVIGAHGIIGAIVLLAKAIGNGKY